MRLPIGVVTVRLFSYLLLQLLGAECYVVGYNLKIVSNDFKQIEKLIAESGRRMIRIQSFAQRSKF